MHYIWLTVACACALAAAELETQHVLEATSALGGRWEATMHFRVRTKPEANGLYQTRLGPILTYKLERSTNLLGGYYFTRVEAEAGRPWGGIHRVFAGGEHTWKRWEHWKFDSRHILERYYSSSDPEYNRLRNRLRLQSTWTLAPYTGVEMFVDADGLRSMRYFGGIRPRVARTMSLDFGYFFETRRPHQGGDRHMLSTAIYFHGRPAASGSRR